MSKLTVYHGSYCKVDKPSFDYGRIDTDFGLGFYVTTDYTMAEKWASRKKKAIINEYLLDMDNLDAYIFPLNEEWLNFVIQNRNGEITNSSYQLYDLLLGATADDKLFATIEQYENGFIDTATAIEVLNCMKIGQQINIQTEKGLQNLHFIQSIELSPDRINYVRAENRKDRNLANQLTGEIIRKRIIGKEEVNRNEFQL